MKGAAAVVWFTALCMAFAVGCSSEQTVYVRVEPEEGGTVTGKGSYEKGEEVTVQAQPEQGYRFAGWIKDGEKISEEKIYQFRVKRDRELVAEFVQEIRVEIPDQNLEAAIREELGTPEGDINHQDMQRLLSLEAVERGIVDLTGIEYAANLARLELQGNQISNPELLLQLPELKELTICTQSLKPEQQAELVQLPRLQQLDLQDADLKWFCSYDDLTIEGSGKIFSAGVDGIDDFPGEPEAVAFTEKGYMRDPVGTFDQKVYRYPQAELMFVRYLKPVGGQWEQVEGAEFQFKSIEVSASGMSGPRGVEVGDSLEEVFDRFPGLYQHEENTRRFGRISMEGGKVEEIQFSDYLSESPFDYHVHHFTFILSFDDEELVSYKLSHVMYDL